jgi:two-component system nitrate/nitrite response regulator NarP
LSRKERALLEALTEGLTNKQLAVRMNISTNTVKFHLSNIFDKLSVTNRTQAIAFYYAQQSGNGS